MPIPLLAPVVATIVGAIAKTVSVEGLKWIATRGLLVALVGGMLPVVLYNLFNQILLEFITYAASQNPDAGNLSSVVIQITGLGGWMATQLKLPQAFALVCSAAALRTALNMIPFVRI